MFVNLCQQVFLNIEKPKTTTSNVDTSTFNDGDTIYILLQLNRCILLVIFEWNEMKGEDIILNGDEVSQKSMCSLM